jgi:hypothetical protein
MAEIVDQLAIMSVSVASTRQRVPSPVMAEPSSPQQADLPNGFAPGTLITNSVAEARHVDPAPVLEDDYPSKKSHFPSCQPAKILTSATRGQ